MGEGDRGSGFMYGVASASGACLSAFLFFFFPFFLSDAFPPGGELSGLVTAAGSVRSAVICAGVPVEEIDTCSVSGAGRLEAVNGEMCTI